MVDGQVRWKWRDWRRRHTAREMHTSEVSGGRMDGRQSDAYDRSSRRLGDRRAVCMTDAMDRWWRAVPCSAVHAWRAHRSAMRRVSARQSGERMEADDEAARSMDCAVDGRGRPLRREEKSGVAALARPDADWNQRDSSLDGGSNTERYVQMTQQGTNNGQATTCFNG